MRWAREGERLKTLDGVERALRPTDRRGGGPGRGAGPGRHHGRRVQRGLGRRRGPWRWRPRIGTRSSIRRAAKALGMHTEASHRFERGADPEGTAGGHRPHRPPAREDRRGHRRGPASSIAWRRPGTRRRVSLRPSRVRAVLGADVPADSDADDPARPRLRRERGRGRSPSTGGADVARRRHPRGSTSSRRWAGTTASGGSRRRSLRRPPWAGFGPRRRSERDDARDARGRGPERGRELRVRRPRRREKQWPSRTRSPRTRPSCGRRSFPGLLRALEENLRQGRQDVAIFEVGRVFKPTTPRPREERHLGILLAGSEPSRHWTQKPRSFDFYDLKGILELLLERLGRGPLEIGRAETVPSFLHPGQTAQILRGGRAVGFLGALRSGFPPRRCGRRCGGRNVPRLRRGAAAARALPAAAALPRRSIATCRS